jgi:hypothetical protein
MTVAVPNSAFALNDIWAISVATPAIPDITPQPSPLPVDGNSIFATVPDGNYTDDQ